VGVLLGSLFHGVPTAAQVVETPVPFDSLGRVQTITPPLVARLGLEAPLWPVSGDFSEARLYAQGAGAYVLIVQRRSGALERYSLTEEQREALRSAVSAAMARAGRPTTEERPEFISEPAGNAFARNQTILAALIYGPAIATLIQDPAGSSAGYLLVTGGTFFATVAYAREDQITRAQNHLATDGGWRGALIANTLLYAAANPDDEQAYAAAVLAGGIGGAVAGVALGKPLTDGEAHAATFGSTISAALTAGAIGLFGGWDNRAGSDDENRPEAGALAGAGLAGYPLGLRYPRRARYTVTAGDVIALWTPSVLGLATAGTIISTVDDPSEAAVSGALTAGLVTGLVVGDRLLVRRVDHTEGEGRLLMLGTIAGSLLGGAFVVGAELDDATIAFALMTAGGILGAIGTEALLSPRRPGEGMRGAGGTGAAASAFRSTRHVPEVTFSPQGLAFAAAGVRGNFPVLSVRF
jgi:hypothetical protein